MSELQKGRFNHMGTARLRLSALAVLVGVTALCAACGDPKLPPLALAPHVELERFMGSWYVIGCIPTRLERAAYNAIENYQLLADGSIDTTFKFNAGASDGPLKTYHPHGFVFDRASNAVWGMRFIWPIKADYRIMFVSPDYSETVIGREARDYVWIMARQPHLPATEYARLTALIAAQGYSLESLRLVPQL